MVTVMAETINCEVEHLSNPVRLVSADEHPDIAGWWCAGMPHHWYQAMRMKWAHDWSGANELEYKLWIIAAKLANKHGWRVPTGQVRLRKMAGLAIAEMAEPARYNQPDSWKLKAGWVGIKKSQWFDVWQARYEMLFREFDDWSNRGWRYIRVKQRQESGI